MKKKKFMGDAIKTKNYALIMQVKILIEAQERQVTQQRGILSFIK